MEGRLMALTEEQIRRSLTGARGYWATEAFDRWLADQRAQAVAADRASVAAAVDRLAAHFAANGYDERNLRRLLTPILPPGQQSGGDA